MRVHSQRPKLTFTGHPLPKHHALLTLLTCVLFVALTVCLILYLDWRATLYENRLSAEQAKQAAFIDASIKQAKERRFATARKNEQAAKLMSDDVLEKMRSSTTPESTTRDCSVTDSERLSVILNKKNCLNPISYTPKNLVSVDGRLLRADAAQAMTSMMADAAAAGAPFSIFSAYRSYSDQTITYNNIVAINGVGVADTLSARPGYSEHQTGLAADLQTNGCSLDCFETTKAYAWLLTHAASYGFIQRYPSDMTPITGYATESWHWRYIGARTATDLKDKGLLTLEEYFGVDGGGYN